MFIIETNINTLSRGLPENLVRRMIKMLVFSNEVAAKLLAFGFYIAFISKTYFLLLTNKIHTFFFLLFPWVWVGIIQRKKWKLKTFLPFLFEKITYLNSCHTIHLYTCKIRQINMWCSSTLYIHASLNFFYLNGNACTF